MARKPKGGDQKGAEPTGVDPEALDPKGVDAAETAAGEGGAAEALKPDPESGESEQAPAEEISGEETATGESSTEDISGDGTSPEQTAAETAETLSGDAGEDHVAGGEADDQLADPEEGPWARGTDSQPEPDPSEPPAESASAESPSAEPSTAAAAASGARAARSSGGGRRVVAWLIVLVLVVGGGYATYPMWREAAVPYAEMAGVELPAVPAFNLVETLQPAAATAPTEDPAAEDKAADTGAAEPKTAEQDTAVSASTASAPAALEASAPQPAAVPAELAERLADVEAAVDRLSGAADSVPPRVSADLSGLEARLSSLESKLATMADEMAIVRQGLGEVEGTDGVGALAADLSARLQALTERLEAVKAAPAAPTVDPGRLDDLDGRIGALEATEAGDIAEVKAQLEAVAAAQTQLEDRIAEVRDTREQAGAFLLAVNQLAAVTGASGGFQAELDAVRVTAGTGSEVAAALEQLAAAAEGVASRADLRSRFPAVAAAAVDASVVGTGDGVVGTALLRIASLVTVRRTETEGGDDIDSLLNRAEAGLDAGDLEGAVAALSALGGDAGAAVAPWLAAAQERLAVDAAVRSLQAQALAAVSGG